MKQHHALFLLLVIILAAVGLRSYELTARSLWFDEAFSWRLVQFPFSEMIARDAADVHPPLYYIVLRGWSEVFGTSLLAMRSFSVAAAALSVGAMYGFAAYVWRDRRIGLLAAALLAFSGWQIAFAWEARMYTLGVLLSLLASWLLLAAVRLGKEKLWVNAALAWFGYALLAAAFAYTHYFAFFTLAAHALFVLAHIIHQTKWRVGEMLQLRTTYLALGAAVIAVAAYVPWIPIFLQQNSQVQESYWVPTIGGWSIPDTFYRMLIPTTGIPSREGLLIIVRALPILAVLSLWTWLIISTRDSRARNADQRGDAAWLTVLCAAVPFVLAIGISFVGQSLYQDRFLVFTHAFILLGIAAAVVRLPAALARWAVAALLVGFLIGFGAFWQELSIVQKPGAHGATQLVLSQRQAEDPIVVTSPFIYFSVLHYAQEGRDAGRVPKLYSETGELVHFAGGPILTSEDIIGSEIFDQREADTLWLVETNGFGGSPLTVPATWQRTQEHVYDEVFAHQGEIFVHKYERR